LIRSVLACDADEAMMLRLGPALWLLQLSFLVCTTHSRVSQSLYRDSFAVQYINWLYSHNFCNL